jgi:hypothetical protein
MVQAGDVIGYFDLCREEGKGLQHGMHFRLRPGVSVVLMSRRPGAPYDDVMLKDARTLIYEGHDEPRKRGGPDPKNTDQPAESLNGKKTPNGLFFDAALRFRRGEGEPELVRVYEKIRPGFWVFNGTFKLTDAWKEQSGSRTVFKFKLELSDAVLAVENPGEQSLPHTRLIPSTVKQEVWKRDKGRCVICHKTDNLHFDHDLPFSKGGTSVTAANIRLLCARHNLQKRDKIE